MQHIYTNAINQDQKKKKKKKKANYQVWVQYHLLVGEPMQVKVEQECIGAFQQVLLFD